MPLARNAIDFGFFCTDCFPTFVAVAWILLFTVLALPAMFPTILECLLPSFSDPLQTRESKWQLYISSSQARCASSTIFPADPSTTSLPASSFIFLANTTLIWLKNKPSRKPQRMILHFSKARSFGFPTRGIRKTSSPCPTVPTTMLA